VAQLPLAQEGFAALLDLLRRVGLDHVAVAGDDVVMRPLARARWRANFCICAPYADLGIRKSVFNPVTRPRRSGCAQALIRADGLKNVLDKPPGMAVPQATGIAT
jgi:hypothetical protein